MKRRIAEFFQDAQAHWAARLECGHTRPVRHRPPWQNHPWVLSESGRRAHLGRAMYCRQCEVHELPADVVPLQRTPTFTETTMPAGLRRRHVIPAGRWARIHVLRGRLRYRALGDPPHEQELGPGEPCVVQPETPHLMEPLGPVSFYMELLGRREAQPRARPV